MNRSPYQIDFLTFLNDTGNKFRWESLIDDAEFSLYIPKWRVPTPCPGKIGVCVVPYCQVPSKNVSRDDIARNPENALKPIVATTQKVESFTKVVRYDPVGDELSWEIGSPYIPRSVTHDESESLHLVVLWNEEIWDSFAALISKLNDARPTL